MGSVSPHSQPVYGLIFLFKWQEDDPDQQEPACPEEVWFANQVGSIEIWETWPPEKSNDAFVE